MNAARRAATNPTVWKLSCRRDWRFAHGRAPSKGGAQRSARPTRHVHIFGRVFATERSLMFAYVRLKSLMFAFFEKKCFFPALWSPGIGTQWVGGKMVK